MPQSPSHFMQMPRHMPGNQLFLADKSVLHKFVVVYNVGSYIRQRDVQLGRYDPDINVLSHHVLDEPGGCVDFPDCSPGEKYRTAVWEKWKLLQWIVLP